MKSGCFQTAFAAVITRLRRFGGYAVVAAGTAVFASTLALPLVGQAAPRTFVASTGSDSNTATNCPLTAPCQSFAAAYSVTNAHGEIIALDTAGYGPVNITHAVSIIGIQRAFIKVPSSTYGITINAGSSDIVLLDNIEVNGVGGTSTAGISVGSGHLILKNSVITGLTAGVTIVNTKADIINTYILANTYGIYTSGTGTDFSSGSPSAGFGPTQARLYSSYVLGNTEAFYNLNPGATAGVPSKVTILLGDANTRIVGNGLIVDGSGTGCPIGPDAIDQQCANTAAFVTPTADINIQP
jgi:hypothetical protein